MHSFAVFAAVTGGGADVCVAHGFGDSFDVFAAVEEVRAERMAEAMGGDFSGDSGDLGGAFDSALDDVRADAPADDFASPWFHGFFWGDG